MANNKKTTTEFSLTYHEVYHVIIYHEIFYKNVNKDKGNHNL